MVKQALPYVRADPSWPMSPTRNHAEARALRVHGRLSPAAVPALYDADPQRYAFAIEDLSDHRVWRSALNDGERHADAAPALGRYVADVAFGTSAFGVDAEQLKPLVAEAINPPLCKITELLVFTEPYTAAGRGTVPTESRSDVAAYADDPDVIAAIGAAKWNFMTRAEALIHGDLHTGSVMVRGDDDSGNASTKAFDSEFAFYGPVGFDIGLLWANLLLAAARSAALGDADNLAWRLAQPVVAWDAFEQTLRSHWPQRVDAAVFTDRFLERIPRPGASRRARCGRGRGSPTRDRSVPGLRHRDARRRAAGRAPSARSWRSPGTCCSTPVPAAAMTAAVFDGVGDLLS